MTIGDAAGDALPALLRERAFDAVGLACAAASAPVSTEQVRARLRPCPAPNAKALTALLRRIEALGADERGRRIVGDVDRVGVTRWWLHAPDPREAEICALLGRVAAPGEDLHAVLQRALEALRASASPTALPPPAPNAPAAPAASPDPNALRPDVRRSSEPIEMPTIETPPEPRSPEPQENPAIVQTALDQQSPASPSAPAMPAGAPAPAPPRSAIDELAADLAHAFDPWSRS